MSDDRIHLAPVPPGQMDAAVHLLLAAGAYVRDPRDEDARLRERVTDWLPPSSVPADLWLGAWADRDLVGVLHAAPPLVTAARYASGQQARRPSAGDPVWLARYVARCTVITGLAVAEPHRRGGIGGRLLAAAHQVLLSDRSRRVRHVSAVANRSSLRLFTAAGYLTASGNQAAPPEYAEGAVLVRPEGLRPDQRVVYRHLP